MRGLHTNRFTAIMIIMCKKANEHTKNTSVGLDIYTILVFLWLILPFSFTYHSLHPTHYSKNLLAFFAKFVHYGVCTTLRLSEDMTHS